MLEQYWRIKREHPKEVLFFRLGDFYEMFADEAVEISALLNLTLTSRNGLPMCGVPYHAVRSYIARLLRHGKKVAICEQVAEKGKGKGLMDREVVEIITPGATIDEDFLDKGASNYLAALALSKGDYSFSYIDISTGDFFATSFSSGEGAEKLRQELESLQARELIIQESLLEERPQLAQAIMNRPALTLNRWADWLFDHERSRERLSRQFGRGDLRNFGLRDDAVEILSAGAILDYLEDTAKSLLPHVRFITIYGDSEYVSVDEASQRNLELIKNLKDGDAHFSLLEVMDETKTAMGKRLLKRRILHPLRNGEKIDNRLDMVEALYRDQGRLGEIRELLGKTPDLERLCSRVAMDKAHGKDMLSLKNALTRFEALEERLRPLSLSFESPAIQVLDKAAFSRLSSLRELLEQSLAEDPSVLLTEGNLIREGYNGDLDALRDLKDNGRARLEEYLEVEREKSGIPSLKIRYNRLIGYFFEVTKANLAKVPPSFIRRQGIAGGERFTTDTLGSLESDINGAVERIVELEKKLFLEIRSQAKDLILEISAAARRIAELDAAQSLSRAATIRGWTRPLINDGAGLRILEGRHPVVEAHLPQGEFIPNDVILDGKAVSFALITGPNMAGKSTYLRQAALIVIMTQMGSFVPAREAEIGLTDRIFCRVGASDNLARGESTFFMEMSETAYILRAATGKSLVIMDEVGRGTSANDGLSIAWAVSEELLTRIGCRTLFATHYHELSALDYPNAVNYSMEIQERDGEIIFLRRLKEGSSDKSYGLHVARLAGLPDSALIRAAEIMEGLNQRGLVEGVPQVPAADGGGLVSSHPLERAPSAPVLSRGEAKILEELEGLDPNILSPLEALRRIFLWKERLAGKSPRRKPRKSVEEPGLFDD